MLCGRLDHLGNFQGCSSHMAVKLYTQNIKGKTSTDKLLTLLTILLLPTNSSSQIHILTRPRLRARLRLRRDISCPERTIRVAEIARGIDDIPDQRFKMFDLFYHISINRSISIYENSWKGGQEAYREILHSSSYPRSPSQP